MLLPNKALLTTYCAPSYCYGNVVVEIKLLYIQKNRAPLTLKYRSDYLPPYLFYNTTALLWYTGLATLQVTCFRSNTRVLVPREVGVGVLSGVPLSQQQATPAFTRSYIHLPLRLSRRSLGLLSCPSCPAGVNSATQNGTARHLSMGGESTHKHDFRTWKGWQAGRASLWSR